MVGGRAECHYTLAAYKCRYGGYSYQDGAVYVEMSFRLDFFMFVHKTLHAMLSIRGNSPRYIISGSIFIFVYVLQISDEKESKYVCVCVVVHEETCVKVHRWRRDAQATTQFVFQERPVFVIMVMWQCRNWTLLICEAPAAGFNWN